MSKTATDIMNSAESMIRDGGYYGFSFRQIADDLKIKSASVHYHFPTKEALGASVVECYSDRFLDVLGDPGRSSAINHYVDTFSGALEGDCRPCLCGILAGEAGKLPEPLKKALLGFSEKNISWLEKALASENKNWSAKQCNEAAMVLFSGLEGAMVFAALHCNPKHLHEVGQCLLRLIHQ